MAQITEGLPQGPHDGGVRSVLTPQMRQAVCDDPVIRILKWVLLGTAIACFALIAWATRQTYRYAPMQPDRFVAQDGTLLFTGGDIVAGKAGFQKADLMDYGSLYGMGSYFGPDYTAENLVALAKATQENLAQAAAGQSFFALGTDRQAAIKSRMQAQLDAVFEHGYAYARSIAFYNTVAIWQWLRIVGDVVFAAGALLMAFDFIVKLRPIIPESLGGIRRESLAGSPQLPPDRSIQS
jgi:nitric oxide reductase large subunit